MVTKKKTVKKSRAINAPLISVGHSKEAIQERVNAILMIMKVQASDAVVLKGLDVLKDGLQTGTTHISDCVFEVS